MAKATNHSRLRSLFRLLLIAIWCIVAPIVYYLTKWGNPDRAARVPMFFHRICARILNLQITCHGNPVAHRPTLFVSNHVSYLDVFILGGQIPGCFIAKSEVAGWPVLGQLARIQNTLFFERKGHKAHGQIAIMSQQLASNGNLILFPEGTSTEGMHVEPFKSSLFQAAETVPHTLIQPVTIAYWGCAGETMNRATRDCFAWYATMPFVSHFLTMAGMRSAQIELFFLPPVKIQDFSSRKACAEYCQSQISITLANSLESTDH